MWATDNVRAAWTRFADEFNAEHSVRGLATWVDFNDKVVYKHKGLPITMDFSGKQSSHTRFYAPFTFRSDFDYAIYSNNFVEEIAKFFGMQDIEIGDAAFDNKVIVKSGNEANVKSFLLNAKLRELILAILSTSALSGGLGAGGKPEGVTGKGEYLYFFEPGLIEDVERIKLIFQFFIEALEQLIKMGITPLGEDFNY